MNPKSQFKTLLSSFAIVISSIVPLALAHPTILPAAPDGTIPRVTLGGEGVEVLRGRMRLRADFVYELRSNLQVQDGELVIEAGTRIEADPGTAIVVERSGRIIANGTATLPIVMTCRPPGRTGCWRGVVIHGFAGVTSGTPTSPTVPGRTESGGCLEVSTPMGSYGGCADGDSTGVLRHVWIENAGTPTDAALALRGVGGGTVVEHVHVFRSAGTGVEVAGGAVDLRYLRVVVPDSVGLRWNRGWRGRAQYGIIQAKSLARAAIEGANSSSDHDAVPRSAPVLRNFTIVGPPSADSRSGAASIRLHAGTAATLQSFVVSNQPAAANWLLDIDGVATWSLYESGDIRFEDSYLVGFAPLGSLDDDPIDAVTSGLHSPDAEGQLLRLPTAHNRIVVAFDSLDLQLKSPYGSLQDLRPRHPGPLASTACSVLPPDPFFDDVSFCGALSSNLAGTLIPWNDPGPVEPLIPVPPSVPYGYLFVRVVSAEIGPIGGARLELSDLTATTDSAGFARLYVPSGFVAYTLKNLPDGCADPGLFVVNVPENDSIGQTALVQCLP